VDELHSTENKRDKVAKKELTYKMGVVKTHSFFDSFSSFPVGSKSGAEASSLLRARGAR
jgi:hypothetical protein